MSEMISRSEINGILWQACDTFQGVIDPSEYKNYILVMLFVKLISDAWQDHYETYKARYEDDDVRIRRRLDREKIRLPAEATFPAWEQYHDAPFYALLDRMKADWRERREELNGFKVG